MYYVTAVCSLFQVLGKLHNQADGIAQNLYITPFSNFFVARNLYGMHHNSSSSKPIYIFIADTVQALIWDFPQLTFGSRISQIDICNGNAANISWSCLLYLLLVSTNDKKQKVHKKDKFLDSKRTQNSFYFSCSLQFMSYVHMCKRYITPSSQFTLAQVLESHMFLVSKTYQTMEFCFVFLLGTLCAVAWVNSLVTACKGLSLSTLVFLNIQLQKVQKLKIKVNLDFRYSFYFQFPVTKVFWFWNLVVASIYLQKWAKSVWVVEF